MLGGAVPLRSANGLALPASISSLNIHAEALQLPGGCISPWKSPRNVMEQVPSKGQSTPWIQDKQSSKISSPKSSRIIDSISGSGFAAISSSSIAPMKLESPIGQYLVSMLQSNTHLFNEAVTHELGQLAAGENAALEELPKASGQLSALYRRIEEVKATERSMALRELIYAMVVQKFVEAGITLTPTLFSKQANAKIESLSQERQLEAIHSPGALEMIKDHLYSVIEGKKGFPLGHVKGSMVEISRFCAGELYVGSIVYGYFLRRVNQRYQLERNVKVSALGLDQRGETDAAGQNFKSSRHCEVSDSNGTVVGSGLNRFKGTSCLPCGEELDLKLRKLRAYVAAFDHKILRQYATLRFRESLDVMVKQAEALFGKPESQIELDTFANKASINLGSLQLKLLVLEAVAFGSFLWDVEQHVESQCTLHPNFH